MTQKQWSGIRRIAQSRAAEEMLIIYLCNDCGIIEYEYEIIKGGKLCPGGCGFIMENEEQA